ncbi:hypothetical protein F2Q68_00042703 [Brassica cretica]|uniref:CBM20 domain-containing protein n=1 Tax=Brassica cretica TaxID=69181 RepID=A0A8S9MGJ1_BRACR|nr:hypothetical protein F2Q68_00042703 [Brassica cretica]
MGSSASKNTEGEEDGSNGGGGGQLYVSLKMENSKVEGELTPHVYGSVPLVGSWDPSNALPMLRESASMSELSFVVPPDHADNAENPRSLSASGSFVNDDTPKAASKSPRVSAVNEDGSPSEKDMEIIVPDHSDTYSPSGAGESKSAGILSPIQQKDGQRGLFVDRGVGSPRLVKSVSASSFLADLKLDAQTKNSMPAAAGAVAAAAVADQMLGPKEDRHLAIVLVGLPARGKTFTAAKLTRYLRWLGHDTKHFNVGKYRRLKHGVNQCADFFRADNQEGVEARTEVAALAMEDMIAWMEDGGQFGLTSLAATSSSVDYESGKIYAKKLANFVEKRLKNEKAASIWTSTLQRTILTAGSIVGFPKVQWRALDEINSGVCDGMTYEEIKKNMPEEYESRLKDKLRYRYPRGESYLDVIQRLEPVIIELERQRAPVVVISHQAVLRALYAYFADRPLKEIPQIEVQWRALDEINSGVCDGMTYEEIKKNMPEEYESRLKDKLRYRYPRGESYLDVIQRLEPVIIELERQRAPVVVISHQAVLRALYAYFADRPLKEIPQIEMPLHTIIEIQMGVSGVQEKRYKLMD